VVRGEVEAAVLAILEVCEQHFRELDGECEIRASPATLQQLEHSVEEEGVVVEIGREACAPVLVRREQSTVLPECAADEVECVGCAGGETRPRDRTRRNGEAADCEPVPGSEDLLVASRPDAPVANLEEL